MVAYLKAGPQVRTYSDYLRPPKRPRKKTLSRTTSFFPLRKLKGNQSILKKPAVCLVHLEEEDASDDEDQESDNPGGIK